MPSLTRPITPTVFLLAAAALALVGCATSPERSAPPAVAAKPAAGFPISGAPYIAAYRWGAANKNGGAAANEAFARWLNLPVVWAEDFEPTERWDSIEGGGWQLGEWSKWKKALPGRRLVLSVPLLPGPWDLSGPKQGDEVNQPVSLEAGARGQYNPRFKKLAENLVAYGLDDSILRLGWEFTGGWYAWRAGDRPEAYAAYWREIVKTMRAVPGAERLQFCWNPALGWVGYPPEKAWPGNEFVDIVGLDVYDDSWMKGTYPWPANTTPQEVDARRRLVWDKVILNGPGGLVFWRDFSARHKKPFSIPEWGVNNREDTHSGRDNAFFVEQMHKYIAEPANNVYFHCYFDVQAGDGHHQLSPGLAGTEKTEFPEAAAKFRALFGGAAGGK